MGNSNAFGDWLKKVTTEKHMTGGSLSIAIGINRESIYDHMNGKAFPHFKILCKYARYFGVDADMLCDLVEESLQNCPVDNKRSLPFYCKSYTNNCAFGEWLQRSIIQKQIEIVDLSSKVGICCFYIYQHMRGKAMPSAYIVRKYCSVFGEERPWEEIYSMARKLQEASNASLT